MNIYKALSFDDVLIKDKFSMVASRRDVDCSVNFLGTRLTLPVISSNMTCVTRVAMAKAIYNSGGIGCLPRFWSVDENVAALVQCPKNTIVSCGVGNAEITRAEALFKNGATHILIDVAQGANYNVIQTTIRLREIVKNNAAIIVGNFSNSNALKTFLDKLPCHIDAIKVGIGGGAACLTRVVTGCGMPTFASIVDLAQCGLPIIGDGGIRNSGDFSKAIAAGATAVMCGRLFVGCDESSAETKGEYLTRQPDHDDGIVITHKLYSGSASRASYEAQDKVADWRVPEGDSYWVPVSGPVKRVLQQLEGGLRSAMSYNNAMTIEQLQENVEFIEITANGSKESQAHGKT